MSNAPIILQSMISRAAADNVAITTYGVIVTPKGRFQDAKTKVRISYDTVIQMLTAGMTPAPAPAPAPAPKVKRTGTPKRTGFSWDSLNATTQGLFFRIAEQIQSATQDGDQLQSVRLSHDIPAIALTDAPRLTSLKKAGLLETFEGAKKSHRMLRLTDAGRALWAAHS